MNRFGGIVRERTGLVVALLLLAATLLLSWADRGSDASCTSWGPGTQLDAMPSDIGQYPYRCTG
jgi:hypothetical protein